VGADGLSAFELWKTVGNTGTLQDFFDSLVGEPGAAGVDGQTVYIGNDGQTGPEGEPGHSAYQLWLDAGNDGSSDDFLNSLIGAAGADGVVGPEGPSAYDVWVATGGLGDEFDFLRSLVGESGTDGADGANGSDGSDGLSAYDVWVAQGGIGSEAFFLSTLVGPAGADGVDGADGVCTPGETGATGPAGADGLPGANGSDGLSAYDLWVLAGNPGTVDEFLASLKGDRGETGSQGPAGEDGATIAPSTVSYVLGGGTLDYSSVTAEQPTFNGDPQFYGTYVEIGDLIYFNIRVDMSNITFFGRGQYFVTLPFNTRYAYSTRAGRVIDETASHDYALNGFAPAGSNVLMLTYDSGSSQSEFDYNSPITLSTSAEFYISGSFIKE
jgi:hypothetical protein